MSWWNKKDQKYSNVELLITEEDLKKSLLYQEFFTKEKRVDLLDNPLEVWGECTRYYELHRRDFKIPEGYHYKRAI